MGQYTPYNGAIWAWQDSADWTKEYAGTAGKQPFFMDVPDHLELIVGTTASVLVKTGTADTEGGKLVAAAPRAL